MDDPSQGPSAETDNGQEPLTRSAGRTGQPGVVLGRARAWILDTDGVITRTAEVHFRAWQRLFTDALGSPFTEEDYLRYVDGRPRYDGVAALLESRGVELPWGDPTDGPQMETVCGLGNRKNRYFRQALERDGVAAYPSTVAFVRDLKAAGAVVAAVSASENQLAVLEGAGVADLFDVRIDGVMARELGLPGKPDPALFLTAAARLGVDPVDAAVVEDARSGVEAGRRGRFGLVVGVDRTGRPDQLRAAGADAVVSDLEALYVGADGSVVMRAGGSKAADARPAHTPPGQHSSTEARR